MRLWGKSSAFGKPLGNGLLTSSCFARPSCPFLQHRWSLSMHLVQLVFFYCKVEMQDERWPFRSTVLPSLTLPASEELKQTYGWAQFCVLVFVFSRFPPGIPAHKPGKIPFPGNKVRRECENHYHEVIDNGLMGLGDLRVLLSSLVATDCQSWVACVQKMHCIVTMWRCCHNSWPWPSGSINSHGNADQNQGRQD